MDMDYKNVGNNRDFDFGLVGNLRTIVDAMCEASKGDTTKKHDPFLQMLREDEAKSQSKNDKIIAANEVPIHPVRLCHEINEFLQDQTRFTSATAATSSRSPVRSCGRTNPADGWIPARSARSASAPVSPWRRSSRSRERDVVVLYGDCSFTLTGFDFITMVHRKLPFVGVIGNNSSWNQIRFGQERKYPGRGDIGNVVGDVRFDHLARSHGRFRHPRDEARRHPARARKGPRFRHARAGRRGDQPRRLFVRHLEPDHVQVGLFTSHGIY